jgi:hypothetical protein
MPVRRGSRRSTAATSASAFYYTHITADEHNKDLVYAQDVGYVQIDRRRRDVHELRRKRPHDFWVDPDDSNHAIRQRWWRAD